MPRAHVRVSSRRQRN